MAAPIIGLVGAKRAGKDSVASILAGHGYARLAFADRLKVVALGADPIISTNLTDHGLGAGPEVTRLSHVVAAAGWERAKELPEVRALLQRLGVAVRDNLDADAWALPVIRDAVWLRDRGTPVVVTDVRFPNEVDAIRDIGGWIIRVRRPEAEAVVDSHTSEQLWREDGLADYNIINDRTLDDLAWEVELARAILGL